MGPKHLPSTNLAWHKSFVELLFSPTENRTAPSLKTSGIDIFIPKVGNACVNKNTTIYQTGPNLIKTNDPIEFYQKECTYSILPIINIVRNSYATFIIG